MNSKLSETIVPSTSKWPSRLSCNYLSLGSIIAGAINGSLHIRSFSSIFFQNKGFLFPVNVFLWLRIWLWYLILARYYTSSTSTAVVCTDITPSLLPTLPHFILSKLSSVSVLDNVSTHALPSFLHNLSSSLSSHDLALIEFTSSFPSSPRSWYIAHIPFLYPSRRQRPSFPYSDGLSSLLRLLAHDTSIHLLSIQNVSSHQANILNAYAHSLHLPSERQQFNTETEWRSEILWARWEAECYASNILSRWVICIRKSPAGILQ